MNARTLMAGSAALLLGATFNLRGADQMIGFHATPGSKMLIDGTANMIHTEWRVRSPLIRGHLEAGPGCPVEPGQAATPGKLQVTADVGIPVNTLKSINEDGSHYDDKMDDIMYEKLKLAQYRDISFHLTELALKEAPKSKDAPYVCEAKGSLGIAGVTNQVSMPVNILPLEGKKLKVSGSTTVKMTSYKIQPVEKSLGPLGTIKTGDEVKLTFDWMLARNAPK